MGGGPAKKLTEEDEFDLLDGIFADLDSEVIEVLDGKGKKDTLNRTARVPLLPVKANSNSQPKTSSQERQPLKGALDSKPHNTLRTQKTSKPADIAYGTKISSERSQHATKPFTKTVSTPAASERRQPASTASNKSKQQEDYDALLEGVDWSDDGTSIAGTARPSLQPKSSLTTEGRAVVSQRTQSGYVPFSRRFTRCKVLSVTEKLVRNFRREKTLLVEVEQSKECRRVILYDEWATTEIEDGNIVNVVGTFELPQVHEEVRNDKTMSAEAAETAKLPTCTLSYASDNLLILHPDTLISSTRTSDSSFCRRKAVVAEKLKSSSDYSHSLIYGNLLHEVFQTCLLALRQLSEDAKANYTHEELIQKSFGVKSRQTKIDALLRLSRNIESLFVIGVERDEARAHLLEKSIGFEDFAKSFIGKTPKPEAYLTDPRSRETNHANSERLCINTIQDIEEDIWSPKLGLKGKVDASVTSSLAGPKSAMWPLGQLKDGLVMPFEIKTGRNSGMMQHRAQTMLYTKMMEDRYDRPVDSGLLYYTQSNSLIKVQAARNEIRGLIIARNEMAQYLTHPYGENASREDTEEAEVDQDASPDESFITDVETSQKSGLKESLPPSRKNEFATDLGARAPESDNDDDTMWVDVDLVELADLPVSSLADHQTAEIKKAILPPPIDEEKSCKRCYVANGCMLYRRAIEKVTYIDDNGSKNLDIEDVSPMQNLYKQKTGHLTDKQSEFFEKWEKLVSLEERDMNRYKKEIWAMDASERQKRGRCFANMVISEGLDDSNGKRACAGPTLIHRYTYRLTRSTKAVLSPQTSPTQYSRSGATQQYQPVPDRDITQESLLNSQLSVGDPVVVSVEPSILALARGYIVSLDNNFVVIGVDHSLTTLPSEITLAAVDHLPLKPPSTEIVYRIDKDEFQSGMGKIRENLAQLFYSDGDLKRRRLIVDLEEPLFNAVDEVDSVHQDDEQPTHLNSDQKQAISKVLQAQDYALILGMPGTGKTTTVVEILKTLVRSGKSILLTSYTHSAVDNILLKIKDCEEMKGQILRLGSKDKIMPSLYHLSSSALAPPTSIAELENQLFSPAIIATTALSLDHALFTKRKFDYCIVDEASQITLPTCLGPLRFADKFILVGDHNQLPPLVRNPRARKLGLENSLFKRLSEAHPSAIVELTHQYRMNKDIMSLSNTLIYNGKLKCGSKSIEYLGLQVPTVNHIAGQVPKVDWIRDIFETERRVVFVDTDALPARESRVGGFVLNNQEADLICETTKALLQCGISASQLAIITLYKQQIKILNEKIKGKDFIYAQRHRNDAEVHFSPVKSARDPSLHELLREVEILTADKSQGRDKDCILMSLVRSNEACEVGALLRDYRRLNVCFTRAKKKLIIFGSKSTLLSLPLMRDFFEIIDTHGWGYDLPRDALSCLEGSQLSHKRERASSMEAQSPLNGSVVSLRNPKKSKIAREGLDKTGGSLKPTRQALQDLVNRI